MTNLSIRSGACLVGFSLVVSACGGDEQVARPVLDADASGLIKEPIGIISAFLPYVAMPPEGDKYTPKRTELDRSIIFAANEVRFAALRARQSLQTKYGEPEAGLVAAFDGVATACADITDKPGLDKCTAAVGALGPAMDKAESAVTGVKLPRVGESAITDQAKKTLDPFLRARGPGEPEKEYAKKRSDPAAQIADVSAACQTASADMEATAASLEKHEEALHLVAVTHQMSHDAQCGRLNAAGNLQAEVRACDTKDKADKKVTPECELACSKAKAIVEKGVPAAALESLAKDVEDICKDEE